MPELPDVEVFRRYLDAHALRQPVAHVHVHESYLLAGTTPQGLGRRLRGRAFTGTRRHGKNLFAAVDHGRGWLRLHFGMTGHLAYLAADDPLPRHVSVRFAFENGHALAHVDQRKLGQVGLIDDLGDYIAEQRLGPDALALDRPGFGERASGRKGAIKAWLMDQHALAGIGNVYADEILFQAGIAPTAPLPDLGERDLDRLHAALRAVLHGAIEAEADPARLPRDWLLPHRQRGATCPGCGGTVDVHKVAGRTTYSCPRCQRQHR